MLVRVAILAPMVSRKSCVALVASVILVRWLVQLAVTRRSSASVLGSVFRLCMSKIQGRRRSDICTHVAVAQACSECVVYL